MRMWIIIGSLMHDWNLLHDAYVHVIIPAAFQQDDLAAPSFLSCSHSSNIDRRCICSRLHIPGVPRSTTSPEILCSSIAALTPSATPTPAIAIRLCPHACPIPGSASISEFTPTTGPSVPCLNVARHAVVSPRYCGVTVNPWEDMNPVRRSCANLGGKERVNSMSMESHYLHTFL